MRLLHGKGIRQSLSILGFEVTQSDEVLQRLLQHRELIERTFSWPSSALPTLKLMAVPSLRVYVPVFVCVRALTFRRRPLSDLIQRDFED